MYTYTATEWGHDCTLLRECGTIAVYKNGEEVENRGWNIDAAGGDWGEPMTGEQLLVILKEKYGNLERVSIGE